MPYQIEWRVETLAENAVMDQDRSPASFDVEGIHFSHWDFNYRDGFLSDAWLAIGTSMSDEWLEALNSFKRQLVQITMRIALIGQCYTSIIYQPFLITKPGSDVAFLGYYDKTEPVGLMFMEDQREALRILLEDTRIPDGFYMYWNDAVNAAGYSAKLLLMFSALETLAKHTGGRKDWSIIEEILGKKLKEQLFGTKRNPQTGLRHRLVHGEYFSQDDDKTNYLEEVHKKVVKYFNRKIIRKNLIDEGVVNPQRHPFGNRVGGMLFIRAKNPADLTLKSVLAGMGEGGIEDRGRFQYLTREEAAGF